MPESEFEFVEYFGSDELRHHVRDEVAILSALPECRLPVPATTNLPVELTCWPASLSIPSTEEAEVTEMPDNTWDGWEWPNGDAILIQISLETGLPKLLSLTSPRPGLCRLMIAGRPMSVRRMAPGDSDWRGDSHAAEVLGYLNDTTRFWAQVRAKTAVGRESLLAALATLTVQDESR